MSSTLTPALGKHPTCYAMAKGEEQTSHSKVNAVTLHANVAEISTRGRQKEPRDVCRYRPGRRRREAFTVSTP